MAGWLWLAAWAALLHTVTAPWDHLGGVVHERLRWLEWFVLLNGLPVGFTVGRFGRDAVLRRGGRTHAWLLRFVLYPPLVLTAIGTLLLTITGRRDEAGIALTALLAYWAGLDVAFGALPLMEGKSYRFHRPLDAEPEETLDVEESDGDPPWGQF